MEVGALSLVDAAWWERQMPASVSCVALLEEAVLSGDWDGMVECRSFDGDLLWSCETSDRIGSFSVREGEDGTVLHATCGREVVRLDPEDGSVMWRSELDGSADMSTPSPDGGVWVTSAVYEIELNDFIECSCSLIDADGEVVASATFDERPWHIEAVEDGVLLGLGRPRAGALSLRFDGDGMVEEHHVLGDSPITCGTAGRTRTVLGHADGALTGIETDAEGSIEIREFAAVEGGAEALACTPDGLAVVAAAGVVVHLTSEGEAIWEVGLPHATAPIVDGPSLGEGERSIWATSWSGMEGSLVAFDASDGEALARFDERTRFRAVDGNGERLVAGLDDGRVVLLDGGMLRRRLVEGADRAGDSGAEDAQDDGRDDAQDEERDGETAGDHDPLARAEVDEEARRAAMRDRLRQLRDG